MEKKVLITIAAVLALVLGTFSVLSGSGQPVISGINPASPVSINEGATLTVVITATAPDSGTTNTFTMPGAPSGATLTKNSETQATFSWTPGYGESTRTSNKVYNFSFVVADGDSSNSVPYQITVNNVNQAPTLSPATLKISSIQNSNTLTLAGADADGDNLTYTLTYENTAQVDCSIDGNVLTATRVGNWTGEGKCTVYVSDGLASVSADITVNVETKTKLVVSNLKVTVDGDRVDDLDESDVGTKMYIEDVKPNSEIKIKIKFKNDYTEDEGINIKDIEVDGTLEDIDDGDNIDASASIRKIKPEKEELVELVFRVPYEVEEDDFDLIVKVKAKDDKGNRQDMTLNFIVSIDKEDDEVKITNVDLTPSTLSCSRKATLMVQIINTGSDDQDKAKIKVTNGVLGVDLSKSNIEIDSGTTDNKYTATFDISVADNIKAGTYPLKIEAFYDTDKKSDSYNVNLVIEDCASLTPTTPTTPTAPTTPTTPADTTTQPTTPANVPTYEEQFGEVTESTEGSSFMNSTAFIVAVSVVGTLVVIGILGLLYLLVTKV